MSQQSLAAMSDGGGSVDNLSMLSESEESSLAETNAGDDPSSPYDLQNGGGGSLEEKIGDALEGIVQKSAQGRVSSMQSLRGLFVKRYVPSYVRER